MYLLFPHSLLTTCSQFFSPAKNFNPDDLHSLYTIDQNNLVTLLYLIAMCSGCMSPARDLQDSGNSYRRFLVYDSGDNALVVDRIDGIDTTASRYQQNTTSRLGRHNLLLAKLRCAIWYMNTTNLPALSGRVPEKSCPAVKPTGETR